MSIVSDSYTLSHVEPDLLRIEYESTRDTAGRITKNVTLWLDRRNVSWLAEAMLLCLEVYAQPELCCDVHGDHLKVSESGPEQEPYINVENKRDGEALHPEFAWIPMSQRLAKQLVAELRTLVEA